MTGGDRTRETSRPPPSLIRQIFRPLEDGEASEQSDDPPFLIAIATATDTDREAELASLAHELKVRKYATTGRLLSLADACLDTARVCVRLSPVLLVLTVVLTVVLVAEGRVHIEAGVAISGGASLITVLGAAAPYLIRRRKRGEPVKSSPESADGG